MRFVSKLSTRKVVFSRGRCCWEIHSCKRCGPLPHLGDESPTSRIFCYKSVRARRFLLFIFFFLRYIRALRFLTVMDVPLPSLVVRNDHCKSSVYMERCSSASPPPPYDDAVREVAWPSTVSCSYRCFAKPK